jgi:hypothetical protein
MMTGGVGGGIVVGTSHYFVFAPTVAVGQRLQGQDGGMQVCRRDVPGQARRALHVQQGAFVEAGWRRQPPGV